MKTKDLSIIVPVYNGQDYIGRCLESILRQSGVSQHEIIVVNDGSTDNTKQIVSNFAKENKNIKLINQKNSGVSIARNNGMRYSYGKFVTFVDADDMVGLNADIFSKLFYEEYLNANLSIGRGYHNQISLSGQHFDNKYFENMLYAARHTNAEVVFGGKITINYDTNKIIKHIYQQDHVYNDTPEDKNIALQHADIRENANFALYNQNMLRKNKLKFVPKMQLDEDMLFCMLSVLYAEKVATVSDATYFYNRHENTLSNITDTDNKTRKYALSTIQRFSVLLNKLYGKEKYAPAFNYWMKHFARQGIKYGNLYPVEFAPQKCAFECNKMNCKKCQTAINMYAQIQENIRNFVPNYQK